MANVQTGINNFLGFIQHIANSTPQQLVEQPFHPNYRRATPALVQRVVQKATPLQPVRRPMIPHNLPQTPKLEAGTPGQGHQANIPMSKQWEMAASLAADRAANTPGVYHSHAQQVMAGPFAAGGVADVGGQLLAPVKNVLAALSHGHLPSRTDAIDLAAMVAPGPKGGRFEGVHISPLASEAMREHIANSGDTYGAVQRVPGGARQGSVERFFNTESKNSAPWSPDNPGGTQLVHGEQASRRVLHNLPNREQMNNTTFPMAGLRRPEDLMNPSRVAQAAENYYRQENAAGMARNDQHNAKIAVMRAWMDRIGLPYGYQVGNADIGMASLRRWMHSGDQGGVGLPATELRQMMARAIRPRY